MAWLPLGNFYADEMGDEEAAEEAYRGGIAAGEVHCHHNLACCWPSAATSRAPSSSSASAPQPVTSSPPTRCGSSSAAEPARGAARHEPVTRGPDTAPVSEATVDVADLRRADALRTPPAAPTTPRCATTSGCWAASSAR